MLRMKRNVALLSLQFLAIYLGSICSFGLPSGLARDSDDCATNVCLTPGCVKAETFSSRYFFFRNFGITTAEILSTLDESVSPCDDFYRFTCGGWDDKRAIPEDKPFVSVFSETGDALNIKLKVQLEKPLTGTEPHFVKLLKTMYDSCLDTDEIENKGSQPLTEALQAVGGWPVVEGSKWDASKFDWIEMLIKFRKMGFNHNVLMSLIVTEDLKNNSHHIIDLDQLDFGMPDREYYIRGFNDSVTKAYAKVMVKAAVILGADEKVAEHELSRAFEFETALAGYALPKEERRDMSALYNKYTVRQLKEETPDIDWLKLFNGLMEESITEDEPLVVDVPSYVRNFSELIKSTDKRVVANYMVWRMVLTTMYALSENWRDTFLEYESSTTGQTKQPARWQQCLQKPISSNMAIALGSFYIRDNFKEDSKQTAMEMVTYIRQEFLKILNNIDWMGNSTRKQAIEKANAMKSYIGYPDELRNEQLVSEYYESLNFDKTAFLSNVLKLRRFETDENFKKLRKAVNKDDWKIHGQAAEINAFYHPVFNIIEFPAGILQSPFFSGEQPNYLNFGAIGFVIGHEITHGFDDQGKQFDKDGNTQNWWDPDTDQRYKEKAQCIIEQYGNYTVAQAKMKINGINTQGENIADNGGIKEAYYAYQTWVADHQEEKSLPAVKYTPKQLFWISAGHVWCGRYTSQILQLLISSGYHTPPEYRVTGTLSNMAEFAKDFNCPEGSPMNPVHKCKVW